MTCPYCDSNNTEYFGVTDGAGMYGDGVADHYLCHDCDADFEEGGYGGSVYVTGGFAPYDWLDMPDMPEPTALEIAWDRMKTAIRRRFGVFRVVDDYPPDTDDLPF